MNFQQSGKSGNFSRALSSRITSTRGGVEWVCRPFDYYWIFPLLLLFCLSIARLPHWTPEKNVSYVSFTDSIFMLQLSRILKSTHIIGDFSRCIRAPANMPSTAVSIKKSCFSMHSNVRPRTTSKKEIEVRLRAQSLGQNSQHSTSLPGTISYISGECFSKSRH